MSDDETEKKQKKKGKPRKENLWQEAAEEFFQESYPSGSGQEETPAAKHNKRKLGAGGVGSAARRFQHNSTRRNHHGHGTCAGGGVGGNGTATATITYAMTGRHGTFGRTITTNVGYNTCGAGTIYDNTGVLPDLTDLSIPNEQKRWEEVQKIRTLPIPMAQKRQLKTQLTTIPMLKLKGWKLLRWKQMLLFHSLALRWKRFLSNFSFWNGAIKEVAVGRGVAISQLFQLIKWAFKLNFVMCVLILTFILLPQLLILKPLINQGVGQQSNCFAELFPPMPAGQDGDGRMNLNKTELANCCTELYFESRQDMNKTSSPIQPSHSSLSEFEQTLLLLGGHGHNIFSPLYYGFYYYRPYQFKPAATRSSSNFSSSSSSDSNNTNNGNASSTLDFSSFTAISNLFSRSPSDLIIQFYSSSYAFVYLLTNLAILLISLVFILKQAKLRDIIVEAEDGARAHRYSDLVFTGWEYFTRDNESARFKRKTIRQQMKLLLKDEKYKIQLSKKTRKQHWKLFGRRILTNLILIAIHVIIAFLLFQEVGLTNSRGGIGTDKSHVESEATKPLEDKPFALFLIDNDNNGTGISTESGTTIEAGVSKPTATRENVTRTTTTEEAEPADGSGGLVDSVGDREADTSREADFDSGIGIRSEDIEEDEEEAAEELPVIPIITTDSGSDSNVVDTGNNGGGGKTREGENAGAGEKSSSHTLEFWILVLKGFLPALTIALINLILPSVLKHISSIEKFSQDATLKLKVWRIVASRILCIACIGLKLHWLTYCKVKDGHCTQCIDGDDAGNGLRSGGSSRDKAVCWESLFGEHLYKIVLVDLTFKVVIGFGLNTVRNLIGLYCPGKFCKRVGTLKFNLAVSSIDILYIQFLSWIGAYFAPFLPILVLIYTFLLFYLNKLTVFISCRGIPPIYKTMRMSHIYLAIRLVSFSMVAVLMGFMLGYLQPSRSCGPFRQNEYPWEVFVDTIYTDTTAPFISTVFDYLGQPVTLLIIALLLITITYYYYTLTRYSRGIVGLLKNMLVLEGHDKQFLFARLNSLKRSSINSTNSIPPPLIRTKGTTILNEEDD